MPRAKNTKAATAAKETIDKDNELPVSGAEKTKRNGKKSEEILTNGKTAKGRAVKKTIIEKDIETKNAAEELATKLVEKKKQVNKKDKTPAENGDVAEATKPKRGRGKKSTKENNVEKQPEATAESAGNGVAKTKTARVTKKSKKEDIVEPAEIHMESPASAAAKGRKRKEGSTEPAKVTKSVAAEKKTATRGRKRNADEAMVEAGAEAVRPAKKATAAAAKKKVGKTVANKIEIVIDDEKPSTSQKATKSATTRKRGAPKDADDEPTATKPSKAKKALLNPTDTTYNKADFELDDVDKNLSNVSNSGVERKQLKISSWNVAGLRSWLKKDGLKFLEYEDPDIFCMQETKATPDQMPEEAQRIPGYHPYWLCLPGGYAGVALYSKIMPINVEYGIGSAEFDDAGRLITAEYEKFFLLNVYVPNSGRKLVNLDYRMRWEKLFQAYVQKLDARKPVIICGDMNVSHTEIDLANPKSNLRSAGFTIEEREKMDELLALGFLDTFRELYPKKTGAYTYWTYMANARSRNVGWRLDYFLVSARWGKRVIENAIRSQVMGSDHCPITLFINI